MKSKLLTLGLVGALSLGTLSLTACSDTEVALGAGVIVGAIIADDGDHHHHHHDGGWHRPPPPPPPRHGGWGRGPGWGGRHWAGNFQLNANVDELTLKTAYHFEIPTDSAQKVIDALQAAKQKDFSKLESLGLSAEDLKSLANDENPSVTALRTLAAALDLDLGQTHNVIQQMKEDLKNR
jgi:hypothetical protein